MLRSNFRRCIRAVIALTPHASGRGGDLMRDFRIVALFLTLVAASASVPVALAQTDYPNRPVRLVSGYAPGGTTSLVGRLIGQKLTESWGQQFILDNRPGGGTLIGSE